MAGDNIERQHKEEKKYKTSFFSDFKGLNFEIGMKFKGNQTKEGIYKTTVAGTNINAEKTINLQSGKDITIQASNLLSENTFAKAEGKLNIIDKDEIFTRDISSKEVEAKLSAGLRLSGVKETLKSTINIVKGVKEFPKMIGLAKDLATGKDINEALAGKEKTIEEANLIANGPKKGNVSTVIYLGGSISANKESSKLTRSIGSNLISNEIIALKSGNDTNLKNAKLISKNIIIDSDKNINIEAGKSTSESKGSSWSANGEVNLLTGQFNIGAETKKDNANSESYSNSKVIGENIVIRGKDLIAKGANIEGNKLDIKVENLLLESLQDKEHRNHKGYNVSAGNSSMGAGLEYGKYDKEWVNEQSTIIGVENFIDYKLGNKLIGIIPTEDTNGGVAGELQSPSSLLNWNLKPIIITYSGGVDENGKFDIVSKIEDLTKEKYEKVKGENSNEILYINGVGNNIKDHADGRFIGTLTPEEHEKIKKGETVQKLSIFNPTNGLIADVAEALIGQVGLIVGTNWNGKQLHQIEKKYKGIFDNGTIAHSQGTIIYTSKLRDDLKTEEGRAKISKMKKNYMLGIAVVPWVLDDTLNKMNNLGTKAEKRRNPWDPVSMITLNWSSNTTGSGHGVIGYNPYYFKWDNKIQKYRLKPDETGPIPKIEENKVGGY